MITFKLKKYSNKLSKIKGSFHRLDGRSTSVGYFAAQGKHKGADGISDYTYAGLANALEIGYFPLMRGTASPKEEHRTPMPFMNSIVNRARMDAKKSPIFTRPFKQWVRGLEKGIGPEIILNAMGKMARKASKEVFDNPVYFPQAPNNTSPNFETGELMKAFTFRIN